jgi:hypothetical protein
MENNELELTDIIRMQKEKIEELEGKLNSMSRLFLDDLERLNRLQEENKELLAIVNKRWFSLFKQRFVRFLEDTKTTILKL